MMGRLREGSWVSYMKVRGKVHYTEGEVYFCSNNPDYNGKCTPNKLGMKYSYVLTSDGGLIPLGNFPVAVEKSIENFKEAMA